VRRGFINAYSGQNVPARLPTAVSDYPTHQGVTDLYYDPTEILLVDEYGAIGSRINWP
jgi:hypothetical protein